MEVRKVIWSSGSQPSDLWKAPHTHTKKKYDEGLFFDCFYNSSLLTAAFHRPSWISWIRDNRGKICPGSEGMSPCLGSETSSVVLPVLPGCTQSLQASSCWSFLYSAILCCWADSLHSGRLWFWMNDSRLLWRILNIHRGGKLSAVWLLHGWCDIKLLPSQRMCCVHHTTTQQFSVTSFQATYIGCMCV